MDGRDEVSLGRGVKVSTLQGGTGVPCYENLGGAMILFWQMSNIEIEVALQSALPDAMVYGFKVPVRARGTCSKSMKEQSSTFHFRIIPIEQDEFLRLPL